MKLRMKKKTILLVALTMAMLFALSSSGFALDEPDMECPPRPCGMYQNAHQLQLGRWECTYSQEICEPPVFGPWWYGCGDFPEWEHEFPFYDLPGCNILSAKLRITAYDVDSDGSYYYPEVDEVSVDGIVLGNLEGSNGIQSVTEFDVPIELLTDDGIANVMVEVSKEGCGWVVRLDCSELVVTFKRGGYMYRRIMPICLD